MDQEELYEKCLRKNLTNIQKHLDVRNLLSHLYEDCLQPSDKVEREEIECILRNSGTTRAADYLVTTFGKRRDNFPENFIRGLLATNQKKLAQEITKKHPEIYRRFFPEDTEIRPNFHANVVVDASHTPSSFQIPPTPRQLQEIHDQHLTHEEDASVEIVRCNYDHLSSPPAHNNPENGSSVPPNVTEGQSLALSKYQSLRDSARAPTAHNSPPPPYTERPSKGERVVPVGKWKSTEETQNAEKCHPMDPRTLRQTVSDAQTSARAHVHPQQPASSTETFRHATEAGYRHTARLRAAAQPDIAIDGPEDEGTSVDVQLPRSMVNAHHSGGGARPKTKTSKHHHHHEKSVASSERQSRSRSRKHQQTTTSNRSHQAPYLSQPLTVNDYRWASHITSTGTESSVDCRSCRESKCSCTDREQSDSIELRSALYHHPNDLGAPDQASAHPANTAPQHGDNIPKWEILLSSATTLKPESMQTHPEHPPPTNQRRARLVECDSRDDNLLSDQIITPSGEYDDVRMNYESGGEDVGSVLNDSQDSEQSMVYYPHYSHSLYYFGAASVFAAFAFIGALIAYKKLKE